MTTTPEDPVLLRRAKIDGGSSMGKRIGYSLFLIAVVLFFFGFAVGFEQWMVTVILLCMGIGSLLLAPAIVFAYGVKAANRHDREVAAEAESLERR